MERVQRERVGKDLGCTPTGSDRESNIPLDANS